MKKKVQNHLRLIKISKIKQFVRNYCDNVLFGIELAFLLQKAVLCVIFSTFCPKLKFSRAGQLTSSVIIRIIRKRKANDGKK